MLSRSASAAASAGCPTYWLPATQGPKFDKKVHKPPLWINVINFELDGFDECPLESLESQKVLMH